MKHFKYARHTKKFLASTNATDEKCNASEYQAYEFLVPEA